MEHLITLVAAIAGGAIGTYGTLLVVRREHKLEILKLEAARFEDHRKETRVAIAAAIRLLSAQVKEVLWVGWIAEHDPKSLSEGDRVEYDARIRPVASELMGALALIAALDQDAYAEVRKLVAAGIKLEERMAGAFRSDLRNGEQDCTAMRLVYRDALTWWNKFEMDIAMLLRPSELPEDLQRRLAAASSSPMESL